MKTVILKNYKIKARTVNATMEKAAFVNDDEIESYMKALSVLLGRYNKYGRSMNLELFKKLEREYDNIIFEVEKSINA